LLQDGDRMSFWKKVKLSAAADRLVEEKLYAEVLRELESGVRRDGLWAKALQNSQGDEQKANALYIGYRLQSIKDEAEISAVLIEQYEVENTKTYAKLNLPNTGNQKYAAAKSNNLQSRGGSAHSFELLEKKDWPGLFQHALLWTKAQPEDADAWYYLGVAYRKSNRPDKAIEAYKQVIRINPEHAEAWFDIGDTYNEIKQYVKAIEACQQAVHINPENAVAWRNLGAAYNETRQYTKAMEAFRQATSINPEYANAWHLHGIAYFNSNQPDSQGD